MTATIVNGAFQLTWQEWAVIIGGGVASVLVAWNWSRIQGARAVTKRQNQAERSERYGRRR